MEYFFFYCVAHSKHQKMKKSIKINMVSILIQFFENIELNQDLQYTTLHWHPIKSFKNN